MSKNLYANEIATANRFITEHSNDNKLIEFIGEVSGRRRFYTHSDVWSMCYDFLTENYPEVATGSLVTGFAYWLS